MRPMYENEKNLTEEKKVADFLIEKWKCDFKKMPIKYELDFMLMRDLRAVAFAEIKCRSYTRQQLAQWGGSMVSLNKFLKAKHINRDTNLPCYFIVQCSDQLMFASVDVIKPVITWSGRKDRSDPLDHEPYVLIQDDHFVAIEK